MRKSIGCLMILLFTCVSKLSAQCSGFPATIADADCSGSTALANNVNINSGNNYGYCGSSSTSASYSGINLNGGLIRICGNATLGLGSWNSGSIVVSCGGTLTINSSITLNSNCGIVNYGTVIINGSVTFQNNNNFLYNESATSKLTVTGNINLQSNSGNPGYVKNAGYIKVNGAYNAYAGGYTCFLSGGQMECGSLVYQDHNSNCNGVSGNRFTFGSASGTAILRYVTSANLYNAFTNDSHWNVYQASGSTQTIDPPCNSHATGWGSAVLVPSASALVAPSGVQYCSTATCLTLPIELLKFDAYPQNKKIVLQWSTISETDNSYFTIEKSTDALSWQLLARIPGSGKSTVIRNYTYDDTKPLKGLNYYRLSQTDYNGRKKYFELVYADYKSDNTFSSTIYPNPANLGYANIHIENTPETDLKIQVLDLLGQVASSYIIPFNQYQDNMPDLRIALPANGQIFFVMIYGNNVLLNTHKVYSIQNDY